MPEGSEPDVRTGKGILRVLTCGSVDDGKSTLIGRLLLETGQVFRDQLEQAADESRRRGGRDADVDLALLLDGLQAEREQGITVDVAYRRFATGRRSFILADAPGHEQFTRNMATGASTADLAVVLVDARKGVVTQTRRHCNILSLVGVPRLLLAVNKMDLVGWSEAIHQAIADDFRAYADRLGFEGVVCIPLSACIGDNVALPSSSMPWYRGPTVLEALEAEPGRTESGAVAFRMPVQRVCRPNSGFRGLAGTVAAGRVRPGDKVRVFPADEVATVARIVTFDGDLEEAKRGDATTLVLAEDVDASRGDLIADHASPPQESDQFACRLIWLDRAALVPERQYLMKIGTGTAIAQVTKLKHRINVDSLEHVSASMLGLNEIGSCNIMLDRRVAFDPYREVRETGGFILIDRYTLATVGAGMIDFSLWRASNLTRHTLAVDKRTRAVQKNQTACVLWFTGLSGAGKSTMANAVERQLFADGRHSYVLDGDNVRFGLNRDLGFTEADRAENIRRFAEVAKLFVDAGLIVLVSAISPFRAERRMAREMMEPGEFIEVFVDAPIEVCEARDMKGLYRKARRGEIKNFTGIDSPYEIPEHAEITLKTAESDPDTLASRIIEYLRSRESTAPET